MALIFVEGGGEYPTGTHNDSSGVFTGMWEQVGTHQVAAFETGRKIIYSNYYTTHTLKRALGASVTSIKLGFRLHRTGNASSCGLFHFIDSTYGSAMLLLAVTVAGHITLCRSINPGQNVILTTLGSVPAGSNGYVEVALLFGNTGGTAEVWINGVKDDVTYTGDTINTGVSCNTINWDGDGLARNGFTDLYVDTEYLRGEQFVIWDPITSAGSSADYTPVGDTTNQACVDDPTGPDDDSTYNRSQTASDLDQLGHSALSNISSVLAVVPVIRAKKSDPGDNFLKVGILHSGSHAQSDAFGLAEDVWTYYMPKVFEDVPGGTGWTPSQVTAAETSYETQ